MAQITSQEILKETKILEISEQILWMMKQKFQQIYSLSFLQQSCPPSHVIDLIDFQEGGHFYLSWMYTDLEWVAL